MEISVEKHEVPATVPKRSRSLDIYHLYKEKTHSSSGRAGSENGHVLKHKRQLNGEEDAVTGKQLKSRKKILLSSLGNSVRKHKRVPGITVFKSNARVSARGKPQLSSGNGSDVLLRDTNSIDAAPPTSDDRITQSHDEKKGNTSLITGKGQDHYRSCLVGDLVIPKRPRDVLRRRKSETSLLKDSTSNSSHKSCLISDLGALPGDSLTVPSMSLDKEKNVSDESKENGSILCKRKVPTEVMPDNEQEEVTKDKDTETKVEKVNAKKRQSIFAKRRRSHSEAFSANKFEEIFENSHEDDEENLEENAARMLSSRFDTSCTGFSGSVTPPAKSGTAIGSLSVSENLLRPRTSSFGDAGRVLRPRRRNDKNSVRKRRHFYEVCGSKMDPFSILQRKIKVLSHVKQNWDVGIVKDYSSVTRLHNIKYEDRDAEWIDLYSGRFKILMFPSEFVGKSDFEKSVLHAGNGNKEAESDVKDDLEDSLIETVPIISWLSQSTHRVKPSPLNILKERRQPLEEKIDVQTYLNNLNSPNSYVAKNAVEDVKQELICISNAGIVDRRFSCVYSRRRSHKFNKSFSCAHEKYLSSNTSIVPVDVTLPTLELREGALELRLPLLLVLDFAFLRVGHWLCSSFWWLKNEKLMLLWPDVYMEMFFVDNASGLRSVLFEGHLSRAIALLFLIMNFFHESTCHTDICQQQQPVTSFGLKVSSLQVASRCLFFEAYYLELQSSKQAYLDHLLRKHCIRMREIPISECTSTSLKSFLGRSHMMSFSSVLKEDAESTFLLGQHLNMMMNNRVLSDDYKIRKATSASDCEDYPDKEEICDKLTDDGCSAADDSSFLDYSSSLERSDDESHSFLASVSAQRKQVIKPKDQLVDVEEHDVAVSTFDSGWNESNSIYQGLAPIASRRTGHPNMPNPTSPSFCGSSQLWVEDLRDGFTNGHKKPRTRVSYSVPFGGIPNHQKGHSYKKARTDRSSKTVTAFKNPQSNLGSTICEANILVTECDRGWREPAAQIVIEYDDQDWKIVVKLSGITKYSYKAQQFLPPGTANRYTHAMMWKGGKEWTLEFNDRSQWALFKEMHEECFNRNVRAATVKNIPIPGVCLIDDTDDCSFGMPYVRGSRYYTQVGTDVDIAMDPSRVLYDMDSDDEQWISKLKFPSVGDGNEPAELSEDILERAIDMLEKFTYAQQCDEISDAELENILGEVGTMHVIKLIHEYWKSKRQKKCMPLVRQFQPPLWQRYQKQLKEWEIAVNKFSTTSNGLQEKGLLVEKPPMFAFCLRPRGLDLPTNKGSKQRTHKRLSVAAHQNMFVREREYRSGYGRKLNGFSVGDDRYVGTVPNPESSDSSFWLHSPTTFSPRNSDNFATITTENGGLRRNQSFKLHRSNSRKLLSYQREFQLSSSFYSHRVNRKGYARWNTGFPDQSSSKQVSSELLSENRADMEEFRLRDASSAAQHALNMAKLKKEKAQWLVHKADLAIHKAVVALMTAEAMKATEKGLIEDGC